MNELKATINFTKQTFVINGVDLISGDYNSTKITFNFEDSKEGTKILEIRPKDNEDKNPTFMSEIINNEVILVSKDSEEHSISPFTNGGVYLLEVSVYSNDSKLSTITKSINVLPEQIILSDDIVTPYLPIFDELMQEINSAISETNNLNITLTKENNTTIITLTKKDGTIQVVSIKDGIDGVGIKDIVKISTVGLVDTYRIILSNNTYYEYQIINGENGINGEDGFSPIATVTQTQSGATISITDKNGTTTADILNGEVTQEQLDNLSNRIEYLSKYNNALIKNTNTGTSLTINDTADCPMGMSLAPSELSQDGTPTPDSPVTIHTISGDNTIKIENKNKFNSNCELLYKNKGTWVNNGISVTGTTTSGGYALYDLGKLSDYVGKTLTFSFSNTPATTYGLTAFVMCEDDGSNRETVDSASLGTNSSLTVTIPSGYTQTRLAIRLYLSNVASGTFNDIQIEESITASSYYPYENKILPLNLGDLEYCKIGNYEDEFYLATESDTGLTAGKWYLKKNIGKVVLNGSETWARLSSGVFRVPISNAKDYVWTVLGGIFSNYYIRHTQQSLENRTYDYGISLRTTTRGFVIRNKDIDTLVDFKNWLSTHNTIVDYELQTPEYILLNDTLQSQLTEIYNWLLSYQDQTNISQVNNDLPFIISATTCYDLNKLLTRVETLESEV